MSTKGSPVFTMGSSPPCPPVSYATTRQSPPVQHSLCKKTRGQTRDLTSWSCQPMQGELKALTTLFLNSPVTLYIDCFFRLYTDIQQNLQYTWMWSQKHATLNGSMHTTEYQRFNVDERSGDPRTKKVWGVWHCRARKSRRANINLYLYCMVIFRCFEDYCNLLWPYQTQHRLVNIVKNNLALLFIMH